MIQTRRVLLAVCVVAMALLATTIGASSLPQDQPAGNLGKAVYDAKCVQCHGATGKGDGSAAALLNIRPRDFTAGKYKFRSTESGSIPTDDDLIATVQNGLHGTSMPDWKPFIGADSLKAIIAYVKSFSPRFQAEKPKTVSIGAAVPSSPPSVAAGKKVFDKLQCAKCHGTDGAGSGVVATELKDEWGWETQATNLTEPWTFRGGATARDIFLRFRTGLDGTPMPTYKGTASESEMWSLANYVLSLKRKAAWEMNEQELKDFYVALDKRNKGNPLQRGKYLVETLGCGFCHSPLNADGSMDESMKYAGGQMWRLTPFGDFVSYNLTSEKETGLGGWTDTEIKKFITTGVRRNGTRMLPFPMPWTGYAGLREDDQNALIAYLRSLPPVYNKIPDPKAPNIFSYLWGKFQMLILKKDMPFFTYPGNAGMAKEKSMSLNDEQALRSKEARP